jgi:uncharacterized protein (AIM24 family)
MRSEIFNAANAEVENGERWIRQSGQMVKVTLGADVLAVKGAMVAYQGQVTFNHESAGSLGKMVRRALTNEDTPLMRVAGNGDVFFARRAEHVFFILLEGDGISINGTSLLAFDAGLSWDVHRVGGAGMMAGGMFNTLIQGQGTVAITSDGPPMILDCSQQPTYVDIQAAVAWSASLTPQVAHSMNIRSMLRGGSGEAFQYAFHGPGFVVVQPSEGQPMAHGGGGSGGGGGVLGNLLGG